MIAIILFWISVSALVHTYLLYPVLLEILAIRKTSGRNTYKSPDKLPGVSVLMAVHNEQNVISEKIESIMLNKYPEGKLEILVGSDASTDNTDKIVQNLASLNKYLRFFRFDERRGKSAIINDLVRLSKENILIITDANVILEQDTIYHLLKHFKDSSIGLVDSNMKHKGLRDSGISVQENLYITREVKIKDLESILWGTMMGPFGGCYALRKELYCDVPQSFLVDDFFINMKVITSGHKAIIETDAIVYEDVSNNLSEEFRRKARIAAGNFQNLKHFSAYLLSSIKGLSVSFFSHKVLRWIGPFFFAIIFLTSLFLSREYIFYRYLFYIQLFILTLPLIDYLLGKIKIHVIILRFITHFISMNFALLVGFINFLKGVKSNVWQPTRRNQ
jgi:cellulose synthase/poly-beta-1,6-N-acetylglucosamine synthase-like glycosyltransferase